MWMSGGACWGLGKIRLALLKKACRTATDPTWTSECLGVLSNPRGSALAANLSGAVLPGFKETERTANHLVPLLPDPLPGQPKG